MFFFLVFLPTPHAQTPGVAASAPASLADRQKALDTLFHDYWQEYLKRNPEFASSIGDKRYNDKISDYSVAAINDWLARERETMLRLAAIDPTGFSDQQKTSQELLMRDLESDEDAAPFKEWEMPVTQMDGIYATYPQLVEQLSVDQMDLTQVQLRRILADTRAMLDGLAHMRVAIDPEPREKANAERWCLAEVVATAKADGNDFTHARNSVSFSRTPV